MVFIQLMLTFFIIGHAYIIKIIQIIFLIES